ncbi:ABC transporter permease [Cohnella yongneupensis]|uniref:ABC transporter permease n=1 Tax=Cohnella yongneupensis TaxID=425006 RepID=A0ABW0R3H9_9BACL
MKAYASIFKLRLANGLQYRTAALAGIATQLFFGLVFIMIVVAFYRHSAVEQPISLSQLAAYIWLQQAFLSFIMLWFRDNELFQLITTGNIAYELCRPTGIYGFWYAKLLAQRLASAILRCIPVIFIALLLPAPYRLTLPPHPINLILFFVTLALGLFILVAISMFIYIMTFVTMSPTGSLLMFSVLGEFFAGLTVPIPLMPDWLKTIVYALPFRWSADFPFRVYSGHISANEALAGIPLQLLWLAALVALGMYTMRGALQRVVVQGG